MLISLRNNKKLLARVKAFDRHANMVLENVKEVRMAMLLDWIPTRQTFVDNHRRCGLRRPRARTPSLLTRTASSRASCWTRFITICTDMRSKMFLRGDSVILGELTGHVFIILGNIR